MDLIKRNEKLYFLWFLLVGILSIFIVRTWFVPDEYWQSLEVAHRLVFGYGFLTWEWTVGLRSYLYPSIFAVVYKLLKITRFDYLNLLIFIPRVMQCLSTCISYLFVLRFAANFYLDRSVIFWVTFSLSSSWVLFYTMSRTLINTLETNLLMIAISFYPWKFSYSSVSHLKFILFSAICCLFRPTCLIFLFPLIVYHLIYYFHRVIHLYVIIGFCSLVIQLLVDSFCYGSLIFSPLVFFRLNFLTTSISSHFGSSSPFWFLLIGFPTLTSFHIIPFLFASCNWRKHLPLLLLITWNIFVYSLVPHKEFRFILPLLPLCCCIVGSYLNDLSKKQSFKFWFFVIILLSTNLPVGFYISWKHQIGSMNVVNYIANSPDVKSVYFLTPCHSTPAYSHIHRNISITYLHCLPNLKGSSNYIDEADRFYKDPNLFLNNYYKSKWRRFPTHFVLFDSLSSVLDQFLTRENYIKCASFFYSHFEEPRRGRFIHVYRRKKD